jgi:cell wall assembly regulator SMI1
VENVHELTDSLAPGASEAAIEQFEKEIGAKLPDDFKESVRVHDGGGWWVPWRHGELLSLEGILEQWRMYSDWQAKGEYATGDDWVPRDITGPIKPVFWNKRKIYVTDNSGDHLTLDLDPPTGGKYGQVLDHSHEVGPTEVVASGWGEYLKMLVADLESGQYVYLKHRGSLELVEYVERELADGMQANLGSDFMSRQIDLATCIYYTGLIRSRRRRSPSLGSCVIARCSGRSCSSSSRRITSRFGKR